MSGQSRKFTVNSGISLFLVLLIIMCLVSFASLSLASARADSRLTEKYKDQVEGWYAARSEAQEYLCSLHLMSPEEAASKAESAADGSALPEDTFVITRTFPAAEDMALTVTFAYLPAEAGPYCWRIVREKMESTAAYEYDDTLPVMR